MEQDTSPETSTEALPLIDAIVAWCDRDLVAMARAMEAYFSSKIMLEAQIPVVDKARGALFQPNPLEFYEPTAIMDDLRRVWKLLQEDFKDRLMRRHLFLRGVRIRPERTVVPEPIPNEWASILTFDPWFRIVCVDQDQFGDLMVSRQAVAVSAVAAAEPAKAVTPEMIATLSDETILQLLEEHARRVVENDSRMMDPRKISLTPIILRKLRLRAKTGEMHGTMAAEARALAKWIAERLPSFQAPTPTTIENGIREEYRTREPRSNPTIPSLGD